jgi:hypothetical protein
MKINLTGLEGGLGLSTSKLGVTAPGAGVRLSSVCAAVSVDPGWVVLAGTGVVLHESKPTMTPRAMAVEMNFFIESFLYEMQGTKIRLP